jgi:hypothetical protein
VLIVGFVLRPHEPRGIGAYAACTRAESRTRIRVGADGGRRDGADDRIMSPEQMLQLLEGIAVCVLLAFTAYVQP